MLTAHAGDFVLTADRGATCPIVVQNDATDAERYAARELSDHLHTICGAAFPVTNAVPVDAASIVLTCDAALGGEEYRLRVDGPTRTLRIEGGRPRGVLYGVYGLLGDHLGCRWFTREVARIPARSAFMLPADLDERVQPRLEYREVFWTEAFDGEWAARNRLNSSRANLDAAHGGRVTYGAFVHTFDRILPVAEHFDAHPEYYSLVKGKRVRERTQLCLTNPDVLQHAIRAVREWMAKNPDATIFSVSQNDWYNPCACPGCKAIDDAEGSHAGSLLTFVNAVADAIAKDHPTVAIDTLAYQYTRKPPRTIKPRPNVIVRLCSIECCFAHPLDGCPEKTNTSFMDDLRGWQKLSDRLYVWDYTTDFAHYLLPFPNIDVLDDNVRTFATHGVAGLFEQGNYSGGGGGELAEVRAWMLARLLWNPDLDGGDLLREFVDGVYGPAAPAVHRYFELRRDTIAKAGNHVRIFDGPNRPDLAEEDLLAWDAALAEAEQLSGDDAALIRRVSRLRMPVWYALTVRARASNDVLRVAARRLAETAQAEKLTSFREYARTIEGDLRKLEIMQTRRSWSPPAGTTAIEDTRFTLYQEGELTRIVADEAADDGIAVRLAGRTLEWAVQWKPDAETRRLDASQRVLARVRIEKAGDVGPAFHGGLYDPETKRGVGSISIAAKDVTGPGYALYELGTLPPGSKVYAYLAPDNNETNVPALFIDRIELVPVAATNDAPRGGATTGKPPL